MLLSQVIVHESKSIVYVTFYRSTEFMKYFFLWRRSQMWNEGAESSQYKCEKERNSNHW